MDLPNPTNLPVPHLTSSTPQALNFNGAVYIFWNDGFGSDIKYACYSGSWSLVQSCLNGGSTINPQYPTFSAFVFQKSIWVVYTDPKGGVYYVTSTDGTNWSTTQQIGGDGTTGTAASAGVYDGSILVITPSSDGNTIGTMNSSDGGKTWSQGSSCPWGPMQEFSSCPAISYGGAIVVCHADSSNNVWCVPSGPGGWGTVTEAGTGNGGPPAIAAIEELGQILVSWQDNVDTTRIAYALTENTTKYSQVYYLGGASQPVQSYTGVAAAYYTNTEDSTANVAVFWVTTGNEIWWSLGTIEQPAETTMTAEQKMRELLAHTRKGASVIPKVAS